MSETDDIALLKRGENVIVGTVSRSKAHLRLAFKVHPGVEDLFKTWGNNEANPLTKWGRLWEGRTEEDTKRLTAWNLHNNPGAVAILDMGGYFALDKIGQPLLEQRQIISSSGQSAIVEVLNMSFLRLVGISEGAGVEFAVKGVYTPQKVHQIAEQIKQAARTIYITYMKPIDITVGVFTQPWQESGNASRI